MIDRKKIEEAANDYALEEGGTEIDMLNMIITFKASINWFKDNLWHDAKEAPTEKNKDIFVIEREGKGYFYFNSGEYCKPPHVLNWEEYMKISKPTRWLYIEDLMKGDKQC